MRAASTLIAIGTALWVIGAGTAQALGFGRIVNATQLGQPLNFSAAVRIETDDALPRECVAAEVQSGDNKLPAGMIRVTLEDGPDAAERNVRVTTSALIDEPVVTVSVTLGCSAKITRRFVVFIDPPLMGSLPAGSEMAPTLAPQRVDSAVAPIVRLVQSDGGGDARGGVGSDSRNQPRRGAVMAGPRSGQAASRGMSSGGQQRVSAPSDSKSPSATPGQPRAAAKSPAPRPDANTAARTASSPTLASGLPTQPGGSRLKLEAAPPMPAASASSPAPALSASINAGTSSEASPPDPGAQQLARERERIRLLEDGLAKLRSDSLATQQSLAALQVRLQQAESERYANPLVYGLAWLSALLALAVATLWWRRSRGGDAVQWWAAPVPAATTRSGEADAARSSSMARAGMHTTAAGAFGPSISDNTEEDTVDTVEARTVPRTAPSVATALRESATGLPMTTVPASATAAEPARELSVEELIDLEQQADFFIVLGQDDAAIELLMSHVRSDGGISPLPYLKLLEIYRRRGDREAYERIRERFNRRFNAYAADWDSDLQQGRSLVDYPETIVRLQSLWASPARVMETLDASVFRRHRSDETFELPAYREVLFLYSIARDLAEHGAAAPKPAVDLLLPLDDPSAEAPIARLSATGGVRPLDFPSSDMMTLPLDLDVSFGPDVKATARAGGESSGAADTSPSALRRGAATRSFTADSDFVDLDLDAAAQPGRPSVR